MQLEDKARRFGLSSRLWLLILGVVAIFVAAATSLVYAMSTRISITVDNEIKTVSTFSNTVEDALREANVILLESDKVSPSLDSELSDGGQIIVTRAKNITVFDASHISKFRSSQTTVEQMLDEHGIAVSELDLLSCSLNDAIYDDMIINITRNNEVFVIERVNEPFSETRRASFNLIAGQTRVATQGVNGVREDVYKLTYQNGIETGRELVSQQVIKQPVASVIEYGASNAVAVSRGDFKREDFAYRGVIEMRATAYDDSFESNGNYLKRAANGMSLQRGVVAVDPKVIPLGTRLYIESPDGSWIYGYAVAADTGGAIKGNKIDLYMDSRQEAIKFGVRNVTVYILE